MKQVLVAIILSIFLAACSGAGETVSYDTGFNTITPEPASSDDLSLIHI